MTPEKTEELYEKYPIIFRQKNESMNRSPMAFGFSCDDGWFQLIEFLCRKLKRIQSVAGCQVIADQVKEKFGTLRFYYHVEWNFGENEPDQETQDIWFSIIYDVVRSTEYASSCVCEVCGKPGSSTKQNSRRWLKTICDKCGAAAGYSNDED